MRAPPAPAQNVLAALREQARRAILDLAQATLDEPRNRPAIERSTDRRDLARRLFQGALVLVCRRMFALKLHSVAIPGRPVDDGGPGGASPPDVDGVLLEGASLRFCERASERVVDHLRWMPSGKKGERRPFDYGSLCVEDLGRVYEGLLELSPGIATEPMCRLRRRKLELLVPLSEAGAGRAAPREVIPEGTFYLHAGLGRKASSSYYTPRDLVRFLIKETLGPQIEARSPPERPDAEAILELRVLDPAMGSGPFLVEACRFLADAVVNAWTRRGELEAVARAHGDPLSHARRLVARRCLYGVDRDPLAVELARLSVLLESSAAELSPSLLDDRLVCGDSLSGPFHGRLSTSPSKGGEPLGEALSAGLRERLQQALSALRDPGAKARALMPFRVLSAAWSGAVMLGESLDEDYRALARAVAGGADVGAVLEARPALSRAVEAGREAVSYELSFPEVFWPEGVLSKRAGFHAVVGNPPWDAVRRNDDELFARFDLEVLDLPTKADKLRRIEGLSREPAIAAASAEHARRIEGKDRIAFALYEAHRARISGGLAGRGTYDDYMLFAERAASLLAPGTGHVGMVFPSAFHANEGAVGVRRLYFTGLRLVCCYSFENRRRLFEIDGRFKFALVVARSGDGGEGGRRAAARCAFYLHDPEWLETGSGAMEYDPLFIEKTGGEHLSLLELRSPADLRVAQVCFEGSEPLGAARARLRIATSQEVNMTYASHRFTPASRVLPDGVDPREPAASRELLARGYLPLHEGKTFHQYTDRWEDRPRHLVALRAIADRPGWRRAARFFRLAFRDIASATNERTGIFAMLPPGVLCGNKAPCEREPFARPDHAALALLAIANSFPFDHVLRYRVQATVNLFLLDACPVPPAAFTPPCSLFLAHAALRLSCNHEGYLPLWQGQLGPGTWRERTTVYTWPVLADDGARWAARAAVDAVVANTYGLCRDEYAHVLSSFHHRSHPGAPGACLAAFDELASIGLAAFVERHDPYFDVPPVETLPRPVIDLPRDAEL